MRAPFSATEPCRDGVSIGARGLAASAWSRGIEITALGVAALGALAAAAAWDLASACRRLAAGPRTNT